MLHFTALKSPDFLIVGAGVIGLATAWELTRAGASVQVIDRGLAGRESSWAGGGMLFPLGPWDYAEAVTALTELGRVLYPEWVDEVQAASGIDAEYRQSGLLALPPADFDRARGWCADRGLRAEVIDAADVSPLLAAHPRALWLPQAAQVRNPRLIQALVVALRARGVSIRENAAVTGLTADGDCLTGATTATERLPAGTVIVCAGAWSSVLLGPLVGAAHVFPVCGQMLLYKAAPGTLSCMILRGDRYLIPRVDGHILVGSTQDDTGFAKTTTREAGRELQCAAASMLPCLSELQPVRQWAGVRPGSPGNVPVIGRHPRIRNLYLNSGHFRYGLTMAPAAAKLLVNSIVGQAQPLDVASYTWHTTAGSAAVNS